VDVFSGSMSNLLSDFGAKDKVIGVGEESENTTIVRIQCKIETTLRYLNMLIGCSDFIQLSNRTGLKRP